MNQIILALDTADLEESINITKKIKDKIFSIKLGLEFFMNKKIFDVITAIVVSSFKDGIHVYAGNKDQLLLIKRNQLAKEPENQRPSRFARGDKCDCMIVELDKVKRKVTLSIKDLEEKQTKEVVKKYGSTDSGALLGEILGPLLKNKKKE